MDVAGRDQHFPQLLRQLRHFQINFLQILFVPHVGKFITAHKERVVAEGLDLQIIVKSGDFQEFFFTSMRYNRADQLPRFTGRADDQPFAQLL